MTFELLFAKLNATQKNSVGVTTIHSLICFPLRMSQKRTFHQKICAKEKRRDVLDRFARPEALKTIKRFCAAPRASTIREEDARSPLSICIQWRRGQTRLSSVSDLLPSLHTRSNYHSARFSIFPKPRATLASKIKKDLCCGGQSKTFCDIKKSNA